MASLTISPAEEKRVKGLGFLSNKGTDNFSGRIITVNGKITAAQQRCIAEAAEKSKPKTPEERQEDLVEEALGIEGSDGMLEEILDEVSELTEELTENLPEEIPVEMTESAEAAAGENPAVSEEMTQVEEETLAMLKKGYVPFDVRL